ncbi:hypothetical protein Gpo141_00003755 [Globisporangium polare]
MGSSDDVQDMGLSHDLEPTASGSSATKAAEDEHDSEHVDDNDEWTLEKKKTIGRHSRRREELLYLRRKVQELEAKVDALKQKQSPSMDNSATKSSSELSSKPPGPAFSACSTKKDDGALWENVAKRQLQERQRAELHNKRLRSALETQLQLAKSLERVLKKRGTFEALLDSAEARKRVKIVPGTLGDEQTTVFHELLAEMDCQYADTDKMIAAAQVHLEETHTFRKILVKPDPNFGLVMEIVESSLLPVEPAVAYLTMWRFAGEKGVDDINYFEVKAETDSNVSKRTFGVKFSKGNDSASFLTANGHHPVTTLIQAYTTTTPVLIRGSTSFRWEKGLLEKYLIPHGIAASPPESRV